ncbi:MAG: hypothetical protein JW780_07885 [Clostridiales bacterium]|nr:hypothetical protein [Clostridiales bacterium]
MNGGKRALIVSILLFVLWGTFVCAPFRYFVRAIRWLLDILLGVFDMPVVPKAFLEVFLLAGIVLGYLFIRNGKAAEYMAIIAAVTGVLFHLYNCVIERNIVEMGIPVVIGLMVAILFMLFQAEQATLFLADAYFYAIQVSLFYGLVMTPVFTAAGWRYTLLSPFIPVEQAGPATDIGNLFGVPAWLWGIVIFVLTTLPIIYLSAGHVSKRKNDYQISL